MKSATANWSNEISSCVLNDYKCETITKRSYHSSFICRDKLFVVFGSTVNSFKQEYLTTIEYIDCPEYKNNF